MQGRYRMVELAILARQFLGLQNMLSVSLQLQVSHDNEALKSKNFTEDEDDDATLKTYGITDGDEINVTLKQTTSMPWTRLTIQRFSGQNESVCVYKECSIANLEDTVRKYHIRH